MIRGNLLAAFAVLSVLAFPPPIASAQQTGADVNYSLSITGDVPSVIRFDYAPASGTLLVPICNEPSCKVVAELADPASQDAMVSFDDGTPITVSGSEPVAIYSGGSMLNESHSITVHGGQINIRISGSE